MEKIKTIGKSAVILLKQMWPPPLPPCQCQLSSIPLEDHGAADEDAHEQDHGPDGRKGRGLRGGRGLALGETGGHDQGCNDVLLE